jgi:hypothetical protein
VLFGNNVLDVKRHAREDGLGDEAVLATIPCPPPHKFERR